MADQPTPISATITVDHTLLQDVSTPLEIQRAPMDTNHGIRAKRIMGRLIGTLSKCKEELVAREELISKRTQLEKRASMKRKSQEESENIQKNLLKQKRLEEENEKRISLENERRDAEIASMKEMEEEWNKHHKTLSRFLLTTLPPPAVNIYYKPKRAL